MIAQISRGEFFREVVPAQVQNVSYRSDNSVYVTCPGVEEHSGLTCSMDTHIEWSFGRVSVRCSHGPTCAAVRREVARDLQIICYATDDVALCGVGVWDPAVGHFVMTGWGEDSVLPHMNPNHQPDGGE
jgi:hypothetical protein